MTIDEPHLCLCATKPNERSSRFWLDNCCSYSICNDLKYLDEITILVTPLYISGMIKGAQATHSGFLKFLPKELGKCLFVESSAHNLISMGELVKKGCTYSVGSNTDMIIVYRRNLLSTLYCCSQLDLSTNTYPISSKVDAFCKNIQINTTARNDQDGLALITISPNPLTKNMKNKLQSIKNEHSNSGHASFKTLKLGAAIGELGNIKPGDIDLYSKLYGKCIHCSLAKLKLINLPQSHSNEASKPGEVLTADLRILKQTSMDGFTHELFIVDEYSCSMHVIGCTLKSNPEVLKSISTFIESQYTAYNHNVTRWHTDSESIFTSLIAQMAKMNILCTFSAPAAHAARVERYIQTIDRRSCAVLSELNYSLPPELTLQLHQSVCYNHNLLPTSVTILYSPPSTPFKLRTGDIHGKRLTCAPFGHVFSIPMGDGKRSAISSAKKLQKQLIEKAEIGVSLGYSNSNFKGCKFLNSKKQVIIRSIFEPLGPDIIPFGWPRAKKEYYILDSSSVDVTPPTVDSSTKPTSNKLNIMETSEIIPAKIPIKENSSSASNSNVIIANTESNSTHNRFMNYSNSLNNLNATNISPTSEAVVVPELLNASNVDEARRSDRLKFKSTTNYALVTISMSKYEKERLDSLNSSIIACAGIYNSSDEALVDITTPDKEFFVDPKVFVKQECIDNIAKIRKSFSIKEGMKKNKDLCINATKKEMDKMDTYGVFELVENHPDPDIHIPREDDIYLGSMVVMRFKHDATSGDITSMSARLAALGNQQPEFSYSDTFAATAPQSMVATARAAFMADAIANDYIDEVIVTDFDVTGAFLHCNLVTKCRIFMKLQADLNHPWAGKIVILKKSLYGLPESNMLFEKERNIHLALAGFHASINEPSVFVRYDITKNRYSLLFMHVDDGQMFTTCRLHWNDVVVNLEKRFGELTKTEESTQHVGVTFQRFTDGSFITSQSGYIERMIEEFYVTDVKSNPSALNLYEDLNEDDCVPIDIKWYQRVEGSLIYLLLTRHDIRKEIVYLGGKSSKPCIGDMKKITRVLQYLNSTAMYGPRYFTMDGPVLYGYVDASFNVHPDTRSHSGYFACIGKESAPVLSFSSKQKSCVSLSSMEAEYVALNELTKVIVHTRRFLAEIGFPQKEPTTIFEDNESTINLANGPSIGKKSKHIQLRYHYLRDMVKTGEIKMEYIETAKQRANILTKPLATAQFVKERNMLMNNSS